MRFRSFRSILDECIAALQRGETVEACLARYPRYASQLKPLLTLADRVRRTPPAQPRPWAQSTSWNAVRLRAADIRAGRRRAASLHMSFGWLKPVAIAFAFVLALGVTGGATAFASQDALPNERLYPVKLFTEDVHVWLTFDDSSKASLLLDQSDERMEEITTLVSHGDRVPGNVLSALKDRNEHATNILESHPEETTLWDRTLKQASSQERVLVALFEQVEPDARTEYALAVADVHNTQLGGADAAVEEIQPEDLAGGIRTISGTVGDVKDGVWTVGGVEIRVDNRTIGATGLQAGATASFVVARSTSGHLYALSASAIQADAPPKEAMVSGQIEEVTDNAIKVNGEWFIRTHDSLINVPLRRGQSISMSVKRTDAGPQVASADAVVATSDSSTLIYEGNIQGNPKAESDEWTIGGVTFTETPSTRLNLTGGEAVDGARALVEATHTADGKLLAQTITVLNATVPDGQVYLVGNFDGVGHDGLWIVSGQELATKTGAQAPANDSLVAVDATERDGLLTVKKVDVIQAQGDPTLSRFIGTAVSIKNTTWTTETGAVRVASGKTTLSGKALEGARAIIWYRPGSDGVSQAVYVHVLDQKPVIQAPEATPEPTPP